MFVNQRGSSCQEMINVVCLKQLIFPNGLKGASVLLTLSVKSFPNSSAACAS